MDPLAVPTAFGGQAAGTRRRRSDGIATPAHSKRRRHSTSVTQKFVSDGSFLHQFNALHGRETETEGGRERDRAAAAGDQPDRAAAFDRIDPARLPFRFKKVVAPMVGQSDLAFR